VICRFVEYGAFAPGRTRWLQEDTLNAQKDAFFEF